MRAHCHCASAGRTAAWTGWTVASLCCRRMTLGKSWSAQHWCPDKLMPSLTLSTLCLFYILVIVLCQVCVRFSSLLNLFANLNFPFCLTPCLWRYDISLIINSWKRQTSEYLQTFNEPILTILSSSATCAHH